MRPDDVKKLIAEGSVNAEVVEHSASGKTSDMAAIAMGIPLAMIAKTIIFTKNKKFAAVMTLGPIRVNNKLIPGFRGARLARPEELKELLDKEPGEVCPLEIPESVPFFLDACVMQKNFVMSSAGSKFAGLKIAPQEILRVTHAQVAKVSE